MGIYLEDKQKTADGIKDNLYDFVTNCKVFLVESAEKCIFAVQIVLFAGNKNQI